jgi:hypothetical protein
VTTGQVRKPSECRLCGSSVGDNPLCFECQKHNAREWRLRLMEREIDAAESRRADRRAVPVGSQHHL